MQIVNHMLSGVPYDAAKTIGGTITPSFLVMHYTAGYTKASAQSVFNSTEIAAHIIIDRDGSILQMVPLNRRANHAGPSKWAGVEMLNNHSIGIEFVNIGWAKMRADGRLVDAYGKVVGEEEAKTYIEAPNKRVGSGRIFWQPYTEAQLLAGIEVTKAILATYPIKDIVSHEEIDTRGWKTDPGPAFPMNRFGALMRTDAAPTPPSTPVSTPVKAGSVGVVFNTQTLNIRSGPGTGFPVVGVTNVGSKLGVVSESNGWYEIHTNLNGKPGTGWVSKQYVSVSNG